MRVEQLAFGDERQRAGAETHVEDFVALLNPGAARCESSHVLARRLGVPQRSIGFIANAARRRGHLVGSEHGHGYYLIETIDELEATISHIEGRIGGLLRTTSALRKAWDAA